MVASRAATRGQEALSVRPSSTLRALSQRKTNQLSKVAMAKAASKTRLKSKSPSIKAKPRKRSQKRNLLSRGLLLRSLPVEV